MLVALSGGADSTALLLALWAAKAPLAAAHVVHDLRPPRQAAADRDACARLCADLGTPFHQAAIGVRDRPGNPEAVARSLRYGALARLAAEAGTAFVATGHHSHDQLETVLLALLRGAGARGLSGIAPSRSIGDGVSIIRPMLTVSPDDARRICTIAGIAWREDATNRDINLRRNRLRARVLPELLAIKPDAARRAVQAAGLLREADALIRSRAKALSAKCEQPNSWPRAGLSRERPVVIGQLLRDACRAVSGRTAAQRTLAAVATLVRSASTQAKVLNSAGCLIEVTSRRVRVRAADGSAAGPRSRKG